MTFAADSLGRRIHIFDEYGIHINDVELVDDGGRRLLPPYTSGLFVDRASYMTVCDREATNGELQIYRLLPPPLEDGWD